MQSIFLCYQKITQRQLVTMFLYDYSQRVMDQGQAVRCRYGTFSREPERLQGQRTRSHRRTEASTVRYRRPTQSPADGRHPVERPCVSPHSQPTGVRTLIPFTSSYFFPFALLNNKTIQIVYIQRAFCCFGLTLFIHLARN